jgi:ribose transport system ATP-binding protein
MDTTEPLRLRMEGVRKSFGATRALKDVSLQIGPGEVHALIGENGAGKSTLMKVLSGAHHPDAGRIELDGEPFVPADPLHARRCGIAMIYQELNLAPHLSVEENILLGEEPSTLCWVNKRKRREAARAALAELRHESIPLEAPVYTRTIAEQQLVEIARALAGQPKVLIMDEPTSSLTQVDTENLFSVIRRLRERGVSIVYISHFLEECQRVCDRYTVLRDGESVGTGEMAGADLHEIIRLMVGREMREIYPAVENVPGVPVLELREVAGVKKPRSVSLVLREGEILGVAGLIGAGRTETVRVCFGLDRLKGGTILISGRERTKGNPRSRLEEGMGLLSENRKEEGLWLNRSVTENLTLTRTEPYSRFGFVSDRKQTGFARDWIERLKVRAQSPGQPIHELSGGNQQKVALARLLHHEARILLLDEPTRGVDVGSKAQIYQLIHELAAQGKSILFISSYLPELLGVCHNIAVMCRGVLTEIRPASEWTEHSIVSAAIGQTNQ